MTKWIPGLAALGIAAASGALAGGIDRTSMNTNILFEEGRYLEFGLSNGSPTVSGTFPVSAPFFNGSPTKDMAESFTALSFGLKTDINEKLSFALIVGQPQLANAHYTNSSYTGLEAHWSTTEADALLRYKFGKGFSAFGGLRYVTSKAEIALPNLLMFGQGAYTASAQTDSRLGYLIGAAYEKPEIALRVSLTYSSAIHHAFDTTETSAALGGTVNGVTEITLPQSVTLEGQTGVAPGTLVFGSIKWAEWSKWQVAPPGYAGLSAPFPDVITGFDHDVFTYTLGVGRKINEHLSLAASFTYEEAKGGTSSRLSPTDGMRAIGLAAIYTVGDVKITGGLQYQMLGDAVDGSGTRFTGNEAVGVGLKVAYKF